LFIRSSLEGVSPHSRRLGKHFVKEQLFLVCKNIVSSCYLSLSRTCTLIYTIFIAEDSVNTALWTMVVILLSIVVIIAAVAFVWWRRRERMLREACADMLAEYMPMDDNTQITIPLYKNNPAEVELQ
jgi:glucan phosphoethanolaminetransferase (alkaline phosphatase superfamily)